MDTFSDLFSPEQQGCHNESASHFYRDSFGIMVSVVSRLRTVYCETVTNGQRHGIRRARKVRAKAVRYTTKNGHNPFKMDVGNATI